MGIMDQLSEGVATVAREAQKALDQGKGKVEELQVERQMDVAARKLGYLDLDGLRGRALDDAVRQELLQQLAALEDQLVAMQNAKKTARPDASADAAAPTAGAASTEPAVSSEPATPTDPLAGVGG